MEGTKLLIVVAVVSALLWFASEVFFLLFAAVLFAVLLHAAGSGVHKLTKLPHRWSVLVALVLIIALIGGAGLLIAPRVAEQIDVLQETLPQSLDQFEDQLAQYGWGRELLERTQNIDGDQSNALLGRMFGAFSSVLGVITGIAFVLATGAYLAFDPVTYRRGVVWLFPPKKSKRTEEALRLAIMTLRRWLLGTLLTMVTIGALTTIGLWLLDVPLALTLGLLAGLLAFIPMVGPIISAVPAVLLALVEGPRLAIYVILLYVGVQSLESYAITPLVQKRTVSLPPALAIFAQLFMGVLFGFLGLLLATPLLAVSLVLVKLLYLEHKLGDTTHIAGRDKKRE